MKKELKGILAFDASVITELLFLTPQGKYLKNQLLDENISAYTTEYAILESKYILCRKYGWKETRMRMDSLLSSNYIKIIHNDEINDNAARYKCKRSISLPDALALGLAKYLEVPVLFSRREKEIVDTMNMHPFDVDLKFLEDMK